MSLEASSQFRRSGQRDDRRRRVFTDPALAEACRPGARDAAARGRGVRKAERYGDATLMDRQPRVIDLVPRNLAVYVLALLAGLLVIAALEGLYLGTLSLGKLTTDGRVAALDLDGEGTLAVWFSSFVLLSSAVMALVVYSVRRHRADDYQGRYRIWIWAALVWLLMSIDETASLHEGFKELMAVVSGTRIVGDGSIWWIVAYFFVLGSVGSRLLLEMRECRASTVSLLLAAACLGVAVLAQINVVLPDSGARGIALEEGLEMLGDLILLLAMTLHARYVIMDAQGLIPHPEPVSAEPKPARKPRSPRARKAAAASEVVEESLLEQEETAEEEDMAEQEEAEDSLEEAEDEAVDEEEETRPAPHPAKVHPPHGVPAPSSSQTAQPSRTSSGRSHSDDESDATDTLSGKPLHQLTRAERKALRKRLTREQQEQPTEQPESRRSKSRR